MQAGCQASIGAGLDIHLGFLGVKGKGACTRLLLRFGSCSDNSKSPVFFRRRDHARILVRAEEITDRETRRVELGGGALLKKQAIGGIHNASSCDGSQPGWRKINKFNRTTQLHSVAGSDKASLESLPGLNLGEEYKKTGGGRGRSIVRDLVEFLNNSWTPFHATATAKKMLLDAGFEVIREEDEWTVKPGGRYFFTRNMSSLFAFAVGRKYDSGKGGFNVIAAHTDSPCPKLKPVSASSKSGFLNVGVQTYGAGLWHTWFDRDLSVAGRVLVHRKDGGGVLHELVKIERPIMRIPTLAIHLDRTVATDGFKPNLEMHLAPVLATQIKSELSSTQIKSGLSSSGGDNNGALYGLSKAHHPLLLKILAEKIGCEPGDIADFELNVCDTQPSTIGGARNEFIFSGRLDNLASTYCALRGLIDSSKSSTDLDNESSIRVVALFDNEEVGSDSAQGAGSPILFHAMKRIIHCLAQETVAEGIVERTLRRSFIVSADMAHGLHPNYSERHEENHQPKLHEGLVIKHNINQRYATNSVTAFLFKEVARVAGIPTQEFVVRNDMGCGSTIGPILASGIGIRTVDCGIPQLSMHSVREMCGTQDVDIAYRHFKAFYQLFTSIDQRMSIDT